MFRWMDVAYRNVKPLDTTMLMYFSKLSILILPFSALLITKAMLLELKKHLCMKSQKRISNHIPKV